MCCSDHFFGLLKLLTEPAQSLACWTVARAVLETAALTLWLSDNSITPRQRISRSLCWRLEEVSQRLAFARSVVKDPSGVESATLRRHSIVDQANSFELPITRGRHGRILSIGGESYSGATKLVSDALDMEWLYRISSGVAHGYSWASLQLGARVVRGYTTGVTQHLEPKHGWLLLTNAMQAFAEAVHERYRYFGWEREHLVESLEATWDELRISTSKRFWREQARRQLDVDLPPRRP